MQEKIWIIYKVTNKTTGKIYIGQTCQSLQERWRSHLDDARRCLKQGKKSIHFMNAINLYGSEDFTKEIIEICLSQDDSNLKEKYWIAFYNSTNRDIGYNIEEGGKVAPMADETKKLLSEFGKKRYKNGELEYLWSEEVRAKQSERLKEEWATGIRSAEKFPRGEDHPNFGRKQSEEQIEKMRATKKALYESGEIEPWNKGKTGVQEAWNKGKPSPWASKRMTEDNPFAKINKEIANQIREEYGKPKHGTKISKQKELAEKYNLSETMIWRIVTNKSWK